MRSNVKELTANDIARLIFLAATEERFDLAYRKKSMNDKDGVEITCQAEGLYPQPTLDISVE